MEIFNKTRKSYLSKNAQYAISLEDQILGLLNPKLPRTLVFETRFGIHTFGLKKNIDILVLSKSKEVVKMKTVKPWSVFLWNPLYALIVELPHNTIAKSGTQVGDIIIFYQGTNNSKELIGFNKNLIKSR